MRAREAAMAGGVVAALGAGSLRFVDDCGRVGSHAGRLGDDAIRAGAPVRGGAGLGDDAARGGSVRGSVFDESRIGAAASAKSEAGVANLTESALTEVADITLEAFATGDTSPKHLAAQRDTDLRDPRLLDAVELAADIDGLVLAVGSNPVGILGESGDGGRTLVGARGETLGVDRLQRECVAVGLRCIVLACPRDVEICKWNVRRVWDIATDKAGDFGGFLKVLYLDLSNAVEVDEEAGEIAYAPPAVSRLHPRGESALVRVDVRINPPRDDD